MLEIVIIADDLTGALDTGVHFSKSGKSTVLCEIDELEHTIKKDLYDVIIINTDSRHKSIKEAMELITSIASCIKKYNPSIVFKKTDSALRGNVGAELYALSLAYDNQTVNFIPALPEKNRITKNGIHYIDGIPVNESAIGQDKLNKVLYSNVKDLILYQVPSTKVSLNEVCESNIVVYDAESKEEIVNIYQKLYHSKPLLLAGCAGLASAITTICSSKKIEIPNLPLFVVKGSINSKSMRQCQLLHEAGAENYSIDLLKRNDTEYINYLSNAIYNNIKNKNSVILDAGSVVEYTDNLTYEDIANTLANVTKKVMDKKLTCLLLVIGGDSSLAVMKKMKIKEIQPLWEVESGTVLSKYNDNEYIITKAGSFGSDNLLVDMFKNIK